ncbi:uncharacterized protein VP01_731g7 [Puccinia sorghi]|uniref:Uncharacterized protein n=1 Tax=Puccinia sorghi TaxID=27349 RepID=A0A0L6UDT0_9BASI|nr:uncharacterized protein VP01_731g7 [Puccinia sorghi]
MYKGAEAMKLSGDIEYPLVLLFLEIQKPVKHHLSRWANRIASSIQQPYQQQPRRWKNMKQHDSKPLYHLHYMIIDLFIKYWIIRGSAAADVETDTNSTQSQALVTQKKDLDKHFSHHNYTLFCLYMMAGFCGLILAPKNLQFAMGASALGFITPWNMSSKKNLPQHKGLENVLKKLGAYIDSLFIQSFLTPNCLFNFCAPQIIQLA